MTKEIYLLEEELAGLRKMRNLMIAHNLDKINMSELNTKINNIESNLRFLWQEEYNKTIEDLIE